MYQGGHIHICSTVSHERATMQATPRYCISKQQTLLKFILLLTLYHLNTPQFFLTPADPQALPPDAGALLWTCCGMGRNQPRPPVSVLSGRLFFGFGSLSTNQIPTQRHPSFQLTIGGVCQSQVLNNWLDTETKKTCFVLMQFSEAIREPLLLGARRRIRRNRSLPAPLLIAKIKA